MNLLKKFKKAKEVFKAHGGMLKSAEAIRLGISPKTDIITTTYIFWRVIAKCHKIYI